MTQPEHERAVLTAHARYSLALSHVDELNRALQKAIDEMNAAEAELRALARRKP